MKIGFDSSDEKLHRIRQKVGEFLLDGWHQSLSKTEVKRLVYELEISKNAYVFSVHTSHFGLILYLNKTRPRKYHDYRNLTIFKMFSVSLERKASVFKFLQFEEGFDKLRMLDETLMFWCKNMNVMPENQFYL